MRLAILSLTALYIPFVSPSAIGISTNLKPRSQIVPNGTNTISKKLQRSDNRNDHVMQQTSATPPIPHSYLQSYQSGITPLGANDTRSEYHKARLATDNGNDHVLQHTYLQSYQSGITPLGANDTRSRYHKARLAADNGNDHVLLHGAATPPFSHSYLQARDGKGTSIISGTPTIMDNLDKSGPATIMSSPTTTTNKRTEQQAQKSKDPAYYHRHGSYLVSNIRKASAPKEKQEEPEKRKDPVVIKVMRGGEWREVKVKPHVLPNGYRIDERNGDPNIMKKVHYWDKVIATQKAKLGVPGENQEDLMKEVHKLAKDTGIKHFGNNGALKNFGEVSQDQGLLESEPEIPQPSNSDNSGGPNGGEVLTRDEKRPSMETKVLESTNNNDKFPKKKQDNFQAAVKVNTEKRENPDENKLPSTKIGSEWELIEDGHVKKILNAFTKKAENGDVAVSQKEPDDQSTRVKEVVSGLNERNLEKFRQQVPNRHIITQRPRSNSDGALLTSRRRRSTSLTREKQGLLR